MFAKLFAQSGLSLDRLRALVEVGAAGSIVRAAGDDPVRQSQYSRQIKELEGFFQIGLVERHGKGIRLTGGGRELARISRFFLRGLANFQSGCLAEGQSYRVGAGATFTALVLLPVLAEKGNANSSVRFAIETVSEADIERRLHDLTLDFGIVSRDSLSRPLQVLELGAWGLRLWAPKQLWKTARQAEVAFSERRLRFAWPTAELRSAECVLLEEREPWLQCASFLDAQVALQQQTAAAFLPDFLLPEGFPATCVNVRLPALEATCQRYYLAWNPRLLRLNPHALRRKNALVKSLAAKLSGLTQSCLLHRAPK